jgi:hypothetical protein
MSSPDPSHDSFAFDPYDDQWDPYDDSSQRQTQADELKLCQLPDWNSTPVGREEKRKFLEPTRVTSPNTRQPFDVLSMILSIRANFKRWISKMSIPLFSTHFPAGVIARRFTRLAIIPSRISGS